MAICVTLAIKQLYKTFFEYFDTRLLYGNVFLRFCIIYCSQGNRKQPAHYLKQYKNTGKLFRVYVA